eukprot:Ihof_evm15s15 gene=Ihof_evmTU15s15
MKREDSLSCFKELQNSTAKAAMEADLQTLIATADNKEVLILIFPYGFEGGGHVDSSGGPMLYAAFSQLLNFFNFTSTAFTIETLSCPAAQKEMDAFLQLFERFLNKSEDKINWDSIRPPPEGMVNLYRDIKEVDKANIGDLLDKLVVVKLNGGLGTTMGCTGPKSVIEVRDDMTFLDLTVRQIEWLNESFGCDVPLVLMNSFNTHDDTEKIVQKYAASPVTILTFNQSRFPRIYKESLKPCATTFMGDNGKWFPPGHGDVYGALHRSGILNGLLEKGKEHMFMSNIDNLGATVDLNILQYLDTHSTEFIMEVTNKTQADVKGGTLIDYNGQCRLLEIAQVPKDHVDEFKSVKKFRIFNTNNLWIKLSAIERLVKTDAFNMEIIINEKSLDGMKIVQLETACGAAIKHFKDACGINVPRTRFLPVKTCSDLMIVKSNLYSIQH